MNVAQEFTVTHQDKEVLANNISHSGISDALGAVCLPCDTQLLFTREQFEMCLRLQGDGLSRLGVVKRNLAHQGESNEQIALTFYQVGEELTRVESYVSS